MSQTIGAYAEGALFAVRVSLSGAAAERERQYLRRLGAQFEPVSKLWVIKFRAANLSAYAQLPAPGVQVLNPDEYRAAYRAARGQ